METKVYIIESISDYEKFQDVLESKDMERVFLDCEGNQLSKNGKLCILQMGIIYKSEIYIFIFDIIKGKEELIQKIKPILESEKILKIIHDVRRDSEALFYQFSIKLNQVFDTILAHREIFYKENQKYSNWISFVDLLKEYCSIDYSEKKLVPHVEFQDGSAWEIRPLDELLLESCSNDIKHLIPLFDCILKKSKDENFFQKIIELSTIWSRSFLQQHIDFNPKKVEFIDEKYSENSTLLLRCFHSPSLEIIKVLVGKKAKNVNEYQEMFKSCFYSVGNKEPKGMFWFMGDEKSVESFTKLVPDVQRNLLIRIEDSERISKKLKKLKKTTTCQIGFYVDEIFEEKYNQIRIFGKEKEVDEMEESIFEFLNYKI
jgi:hypothetical protein